MLTDDVIAAAKERLTGQGVDIRNLEGYGLPAIETVAGDDCAAGKTVLDCLVELNLWLHEIAEQEWTPFCFVVPAWAKLCVGDAPAFLAAIEDLRALIAALRDREMDVVHCLQKGPPAVAEDCPQTWVIPIAQVLAIRLAQKGLNPTQTLQQGVGSLYVVSGDDADLFAELCGTLESFIDRLDEFGISPCWPIFCGVDVLAQTCEGDPKGFSEYLTDLADLAIAMRQSEMSPYPCIEHGLTKAFPVANGCKEVQREILPLAYVFATHDCHPGVFLEFGVPQLAGNYPGTTATELIAWTEESAREGLDAGSFLGFALPHLGQFYQDHPDRFAGMLADGRRLLAAMKANDIDPMFSLQHGIPEMLSGWYQDDREDRLSPAEMIDVMDAIMALTIRLAENRIVPRPTIGFGLGRLFYLPAMTLERWRQVLAAEALLATQDGLSRGFFGAAVPAVLDLAGDDDKAFGEQLQKVTGVVRLLQSMGFDCVDLLRRGLPAIIDGARKQPREAVQQIFQAFMDNLQELVDVLQQKEISPNECVATHLPQVVSDAGGSAGVVNEVFAFCKSTAATGVDPALYLAAGIPEMITIAAGRQEVLAELLDDVRQTVFCFTENDLTDHLALGQALQTMGAAAGQDETVLRRTLQFLRELAGQGVDAAGALHWNADAIEVGTEGRLDEVLPPLADFLIACNQQELDVAAAAEHCLPHVFAIATSAEDLQCLLGMVQSLAQSQKESGIDLSAVFEYGARAAKTVAGERQEVFSELLQDLAKDLLAADGKDLLPVLRQTANLLAATTDDPKVLLTLSRRLAEIAADDEGMRDLLLEQALPTVVSSAAGDDRKLAAYLDNLDRIHCEHLAGDPPGPVFDALPRLHSLVCEQPDVWEHLLMPTLQAQKQHAATAFELYYRLQHQITDADAMALLRHVVTQYGVEAIDILGNFLSIAVHCGSVASLSGEKNLITSFLEEIPYRSADYYDQYKAIMTDDDLGPAAKRERLTVMRRDLEALSTAVIAGDVSEGQERHALFGLVLYHVFPPAYSVSRQQYINLYRRFADHADHLKTWNAREAVASMHYNLAKGAYCLRDGVTVDLAAWEILNGIAKTTAPSDHDGDLAPLGQKAFQAWLDGDLAKADCKREVLTDTYCFYLAGNRPLPPDLHSAEDLLRYREFLAEAVKEILQEALHQFRQSDPERYARQAVAKLAPRPQVGKGLLRAIAKTAAALAAGRVDREDARDRLRRQLRGFELDDEQADAILAVDRERLRPLIAGLPLAESDVDPEAAQKRILQDLVGSDLAAMQRELFGGDGAPPKLEYRQAAEGSGMAIDMVVTKRKAHAPVGFCEGVCTAPDEQLWERSDFLQTVFWGPGQHAWGGMHLLIVKEDGKEYLVLPGINPSMKLLHEVEADTFLDAAFNFAGQIANAWGLAGVWLPANYSILSNRGPIHQAVRERNLSSRDTGHHQFSFSPYAYSFDAVLVVE